MEEGNKFLVFLFIYVKKHQNITYFFHFFEKKFAKRVFGVMRRNFEGMKMQKSRVGNKNDAGFFVDDFRLSYLAETAESLT